MGMANFLSMFCSELQKLLQPIYDLTRKGSQFVWEKNSKMYLKKYVKAQIDWYGTSVKVQECTSIRGYYY